MASAGQHIAGAGQQTLLILAISDVIHLANLLHTISFDSMWQTEFDVIPTTSTHHARFTSVSMDTGKGFPHLRTRLWSENQRPIVKHVLGS